MGGYIELNQREARIATQVKSQDLLRQKKELFKKVRISGEVGLDPVNVGNIIESLQREGIYVIQTLDNNETILQPIQPPQQETNSTTTSDFDDTVDTYFGPFRRH